MQSQQHAKMIVLINLFIHLHISITVNACDKKERQKYHLVPFRKVNYLISAKEYQANICYINNY